MANSLTGQPRGYTKYLCSLCSLHNWAKYRHCFRYICNAFPELSEKKLKVGISDVPKI